MKKKMTSLIAVLTTIVLFSGCGNSDNANTSIDDKNSEEVSVNTEADTSLNETDISSETDTSDSEPLIVDLEEGQTYTDNDGNTYALNLTPDSQREDAYNVNFSYNGSTDYIEYYPVSEEVDSNNYYCFYTTYCGLIFQGDTIYWLYSGSSENDYQDTFLYTYDKDSDSFVGTDCYGGGVDDGIDSLDSFHMYSVVNNLGTFGGNQDFAIKDGKFEAVNSMITYVFYGEDSYNYYITTKAKVSVILDDADAVLENGSKIHPTGCDDTYVYFTYTDDSGSEHNGKVEVIFDSENYIYTIDGVDINELFESLPYAG